MKTNQKLLSLLKDQKTVKVITFVDYIPPILANIFSILFAMFIIFELKNVLNNGMLIFLSIFLTLFIIQNEITKVKQIRQFFNGNKTSLFVFTITFIISVSLSSIGMYFFTNKSNEIKNNSNIEKTTLVNDVSKEYLIKINEIHNQSFEDTKEYKTLTNEIDYWKGKTAATLNERTIIRGRVEKIQNDLISRKNAFNESKEKRVSELKEMQQKEINIIEAKHSYKMDNVKTNNFVTWIMLIVILIVEFATIFLNKTFVDKQKNVDKFLNSDLAKKYVLTTNMLTALYMAEKDSQVNINIAKFALYNENIQVDWDTIKLLYNNLISIGVLDEGIIKNINGKQILYNKLMMLENEAIEKIDKYYQRFFEIV